MNSNNVTVIGLQWGDEGKGKVVDALTETSRYVVRFCGGANAGHTVCVGDQKYAVHLIPCGVFHEGIRNVIGNGLAFDPVVALGEIQELRERGIAISADNFLVSSAAQVVMPWHKLEDTLSEASLGAGKIGTTARGIGPCYSDKARRTTAIRAEMLTDEAALRTKIAEIVAIKNATFAALYDGAEALDAAAIADQFVEIGKQLAPMICNTGAILRQACKDGDRILFEGGQGSMLDIDHGTYPFVTSSPVSACGVSPGTGVPPSQIGRVVGLMKAYSTRVGAGPFPTEQDNETGQFLRDRGNEYGTTTGRPRRCGWFDAVAVKYAAELSGVDELALSLLDVLTGLDEIKVCTGYRAGGEDVVGFDATAMDDVQCVYETMPGWQEDITTCASFDDLPAAAQAYVSRMEELIERPVGVIGVGPKRSQTIFHHTQVIGSE